MGDVLERLAQLHRLCLEFLNTAKVLDQSTLVIGLQDWILEDGGRSIPAMYRFDADE